MQGVLGRPEGERCIESVVSGGRMRQAGCGSEMRGKE